MEWPDSCPRRKLPTGLTEGVLVCIGMLTHFVDLVPQSHKVEMCIRDSFTIDSAETKDIDDAISLTKTPEGGFELGVHIADVSHYVKPGSELDNEAFHRATSVYYADQVVPMQMCIRDRPSSRSVLLPKLR